MIDEGYDDDDGDKLLLQQRLEEVLRKEDGRSENSYNNNSGSGNLTYCFAKATELMYRKLVDRMEYKSYEANEYIFKAKAYTTPALYLVMKGGATKIVGGIDGIGSSHHHNIDEDQLMSQSWHGAREGGDADGLQQQQQLGMLDMSSERPVRSSRRMKSATPKSLEPLAMSDVSGSPRPRRMKSATPRSLRSSLRSSLKSSTRTDETVSSFGADLLYKAEFRKTDAGKLVQNLLEAPYSVRASSNGGCHCAVISLHDFREAKYAADAAAKAAAADFRAAKRAAAEATAAAAAADFREAKHAADAAAEAEAAAEPMGGEGESDSSLIMKDVSERSTSKKKRKETPEAPKTPKKPTKSNKVPKTPKAPKTPKRSSSPKKHKKPTATPKAVLDPDDTTHQHGRKCKHKDHLGEIRPRAPPLNIFQDDLPGDISEFVRPVHPKTKEERKLIKSAMKDKAVLKLLPEATRDNLALALEKAHASAGMAIVKQGSTDDYYYIVSKGECEQLEVDEDGEPRKKSKTIKAGDSFGDEALNTNDPREASVHAKTDVEVFRVDRKTYRRLLEKDVQEERQRKLDLLDKAGFLQNTSSEDMEKLIDIMVAKKFRKGDFVCKKEDTSKSFLIVSDGKVACRNVTSKKGEKRDDYKLGPGGNIGRQMMVEMKDPVLADVVGSSSKGIVYIIDQGQFCKVVGQTFDLIPLEDKALGTMVALQRSPGKALTQADILKISNCIINTTYQPGEVIVEHGVEQEVGMYFIRDGDAKSAKGGARFPTLVNAGYRFGEELFIEAREANAVTGVSKLSLTAGDSECIVGVLMISDYYNALSGTVDTQSSRSAKKSKAIKKPSSGQGPKWPKCDISLFDLDRQVILGQGNFGQVWLVSDVRGKMKKPCVLKMQSKHDLVTKGKVEACIGEKRILQKLNFPFIVDLVNAYQDNHMVYMLMEYLPGGELYNIMNPYDRVILPESQAKFYALAIADAFAYIHSKKIIFRDLKAENVMIDKYGYPKLIDFGFAKLVESKTFTLCGTPGYLAPEVVMNTGHSKSVDHWQLGVLIYDMLSFDSPFFDDHMDQNEQFRCVIEDCVPKIKQPVSPEAWDLIVNLLVKDPKKRLGSLKRGEHDILHHKWFEDLSLAELRKRAIKAPWTPVIKDPYDTSNFDDWSDVQDIAARECQELCPEQAIQFDSF